MKVGTAKVGKTERTIAIHDDGSVSISIISNRLDARRLSGKDYWTLLDYSEVIDAPVTIAGTTMKPRLMVRLICKPSAIALRKSRLGEFNRLIKKCKT